MTETVVVLSTADFNAAVWTNKQHLATRLARHLKVIYIESMGLRQPTFSLADVKRIMKRLFTRSTPRSAQTTKSDLRIVKPHVLPFHNLAIVRKINARLLHQQMRQLADEMPSPPVLWTFSPVTYGVEKYFGKVVYHSVDLLHTLPHMPTPFMLKSERDLVRRADVIVASSTGVRRHLESLTERTVELWENVADTSLYAAIKNPDRVPRAVFAGNLTGSKVDFTLLQHLAATGTEIVLAGPSAIDGTQASEDMAELKKYPNVIFAGNLAPAELAHLLNSCTVGLIPYHVNQYTTGVFPMKVYEYLASGLAVVSTPLPSLQNVHDKDIHTVSAQKFIETVKNTLISNTDLIESRKKRASKHSWESRTAEALTLITGGRNVEN